MTSWRKEEIKISDGTKVLAQMPVIVSASRSTDIPAFYADWFMERLKAGYVKWFNPFNGVPLYVGFKKMRCVVFWSKNPRPMLAHLDALDAICPNYYFQFTLNDYDAERIEPRVPPLEERVETFKRLSERVGKDRVVWRFDPLILTDKLSVSDILAKVERLGDQVAQYTSRLVFSFIDINAYKKVSGNLRRAASTPASSRRMKCAPWRNVSANWRRAGVPRRRRAARSKTLTSTASNTTAASTTG